MVGLGELAGLFAALAWGVTSLVVRHFVNRVNVILYNATRITVATGYGIVFLLIPGVLGLHQITFGPRPLEGVSLLVISVFFGLGIGDSIYFLAIERIGVARAMPLAMTHPLLATIIAVPLLGEPVTFGLIAALFLIPMGMFLVSRPARGLVLPPVDAAAAKLGLTLAIATSVCWALSWTISRPGLDQVDVVTATVIRLGAGAIFLWLLAWRTGHLPHQVPDRVPPWWLTLSGAVLTSTAMLLFVYCIYEAGAARAATLSASAPLFAIPGAAFFLHERVTRRMAIGTLLAVAGVMMLVSF